MQGYRFQQLAYLIVPLMVGFEMFMSARVERNKAGRESAGALALDIFGFVFAAVVPAVFLLTIATLEFNLFPLQEQTLHRLDRYAVMFMFLGAWWQVFLLAGLRARRIEDGENVLRPVLLPYFVLGAFVSALILWVAPWNLMWVSIGWFVLTAAVLAGFKVKPAKVARVFMVLALFGFFGENVLFIFLDSVV